MNRGTRVALPHHLSQRTPEPPFCRLHPVHSFGSHHFGLGWSRRFSAFPLTSIFESPVAAKAIRGKRHKTPVFGLQPAAPMRRGHVANICDGRPANFSRWRHASSHFNELPLTVVAPHDRSFSIGKHARPNHLCFLPVAAFAVCQTWRCCPKMPIERACIPRAVQATVAVNPTGLPRAKRDEIAKLDRVRQAQL